MNVREIVESFKEKIRSSDFETFVLSRQDVCTLIDYITALESAQQPSKSQLRRLERQQAKRLRCTRCNTDVLADELSHHDSVWKELCGPVVSERVARKNDDV